MKQKKMNVMYSAIYTTFPTLEQAKKFGRQVIEERLGACVNIISDVTSIYRWKESIEEEKEFIVWLKTRDSLVNRVEKLLKSIHSYEIPAFAVYKIHSGSEKYLQWLSEETADSNINR
ncbi:MAG: divalent-cation tolerance protein CutA [Candidatus Hodarchaeales archaeon]|jgi:periplasmic divalent cation tolerance protein